MNLGKITGVVLTLFLLCLVSYPQQEIVNKNNINKEYSFRTKSFGKEDGYFIKQYQTSLVDAYGTLWVGGNIEDYSTNQLNKGYLGLFFFNGTKFQEFPFSDSLKRANHIELIRGREGKFLAMLYFDNRQLLFLINPIDLSYKEVIQPVIQNEEIESTQLFSIGETLYVTYTSASDSTTVFYKWKKNEGFELLFDAEFHEGIAPYFEQIISFKYFSILHDKHSGVYLFKESKNALTKISSEDLHVSGKKGVKIDIVDRFQYGDTTYFKFNISKDYYYFDEPTASWKRSIQNKFSLNSSNDYTVINDESNSLIFRVREKANLIELAVFSKSKDELLQVLPLKIFNGMPKVNSRNYNKEIFLFRQDQLVQISYHQLKVKSFLNSYSIRSMMELSPNKLLVGTEFNGLIELDLTTGEETEYTTFLEGKPYTLGPNRGIFKDSAGIFSNYGSGICFINGRTRNVTTYRYFPVMVMKEKGNSIYYGTDGYRLMRFDRKLRKNIQLSNTEKLNMQDLLIDGDTIYSATLSGLLVYCNGKQELIKSNSYSNEFLCLVKHPFLGLLVGSIDGRVLIYDSKNKSFTSLYSDDFNSSIATMLIDSENNVWINSFKGFISFDVKHNTYTRYGVQDGFSNNEANRYSALQLQNGNFLIGTLKGLNYFNPLELSETKIQTSLKFTEIKYYGSNKEEKMVMSPKEISQTDQIILQPDNRSISLSFGFTDLFDIHEDLRFKYRLNGGAWYFSNDFGNLFLSSLAPDNYELEIVAINQLEKEIGNPIKLTVIAKQFFYKTGWFLMLVVLAFLGISSWVVWQYIKNQNLKQYFADKIINAHIEEQASLSEKLHDSVGQKLLLVKNNLILHKKIPKEELTHLDDILLEVRNISHDLHPLYFEKLGLKESVENLVEEFQRNSTIFYSHEIDYQNTILSSKKEIMLFEIVRECLNNVEKHSKAEACLVSFSIDNKKTSVLIKDNGKGFEAEKRRDKFSLGLKTMKEKAGYLNAELSVISKVGKGTEIRLKLK